MENQELNVKVEEVDDVILLIEVMKQAGLPEILDEHLRRHGLHQGMSWGWLGTIWLAHILSQGDHRKLTVREWVSRMPTTLEGVSGQAIRDTDWVRLDATTVSGFHEGTETGLFQFGFSKDNPALKQVKVMLASLDPLGMPLVTTVVSGEKADDPLYIPIVDQVVDTLDLPGLLFVGDSKMSASATWAHLAGRGHFYLCPLPQSEKTWGRCTPG